MLSVHVAWCSTAAQASLQQACCWNAVAAGVLRLLVLVPSLLVFVHGSFMSEVHSMEIEGERRGLRTKDYETRID